MAIAQSSINLGKSGRSGQSKSGTIQPPSGTPDVLLQINTATIMTKGQVLDACKQMIDHLSGYLK